MSHTRPTACREEQLQRDSLLLEGDEAPHGVCDDEQRFHFPEPRKEFWAQPTCLADFTGLRYDDEEASLRILQKRFDEAVLLARSHRFPKGKHPSSSVIRNSYKSAIFAITNGHKKKLFFLLEFLEQHQEKFGLADDTTTASCKQADDEFELSAASLMNALYTAECEERALVLAVNVTDSSMQDLEDLFSAILELSPWTLKHLIFMPAHQEVVLAAAAHNTLQVSGKLARILSR